MPKPLRDNDYVTTADGTLCRIFDIEREQARVRPVNEKDQIAGDGMWLPLNELTRVRNPFRPKIVTEGVPAERPPCAWCDRPLKPEFQYFDAEGKYTWRTRAVRRVFTCWRAYEGVFCTTACCIKFAGASYRGGFRRSR